MGRRVCGDRRRPPGGWRAGLPPSPRVGRRGSALAVRPRRRSLRWGRRRVITDEMGHSPPADRSDTTLVAHLQQRRAELERTNSELRYVSSVVAHDLREPLAVVAGFADLLQRRYGGHLGAEGDEMLAAIAH